MTVQHRPLRVVLDTNVLVAILMYDDPALEPLRAAWRDGAVMPLIDAACQGELERVLDYPELAARAQAARASVSAFLAACERVPDEAPGPDCLPICRDEDDQKFLMLASRGRADMLLTRDRLLLDLARSAPFPVLAPEVLASRIASATAPGHCVGRPRELG